jgi:hypothetical protein
MSIRRRRKKLTSLISNLDRDIRSTTLRQVKRQTAPAASDVTEEAETTNTDTTTPPVGTEITETAPDQWAKVVGGYYYPPTRTGGLGQVELFIGEDLQLSTSDKMYVSGTEVKWNQTSGGKTYTGSFRPNTSSYESTTTIRVVSQYGNPAWSTRAASTKPTYASIPSGVTNSILYTVTNKDYIPSRVTLSFRGTVASYYATTTTATITFTAAHHFVVGHIVDVSDLGAPMSDIDGIVKITAVPSNTQISYEFVKPLSASITTTTPSTTSYINAVVSKYTTVGSSWISSTTKKVYIWDGLRWVGYTEALEDGLVTDDGVAPAPPESLSLSSEGYAEAAVLGKISKSSVTLGWTAPTTNASGASLNDLAGYRIWYSNVGATGPWIGKADFGLETTQTILGLTPAVTYYFKVIAFDTYGMDSVGLSGSILTEKKALSVEIPSAPILTSRLGTIKVAWDGKDNTGAAMAVGELAYIEVHYSTTSGFTPGPTTVFERISAGGSGYVIVADLDYGTDYYFKFIAIDINNRVTASSIQSTAKVTPLVDVDLIAAKLNSPLSTWPFANGAVTPGALAINAINASNIFGENVIVQSAIAANAIYSRQIAAGEVTAGKIGANAIVAANIQALQITTDLINANAITTAKINAGAITAEKIQAGSITGDRIDATTRIRLGSSNSTNPTNYVEFGYITLPGAVTAAPGIAGQYGGSPNFYMGGWSGGAGEFSGLSLGIISGNSKYDVFRSTSYDNGLNNTPDLTIKGGSVLIKGEGGTYSDPSFGDISLSTTGFGRVTVSNRLRIGEFGGFSDASSISTDHPFQIGSDSGINMRMDNNELFSTSSGSPSPLYLSHTGGKIHVGGNVSELGGAANTGVWGNVIGTTGMRDVYIADTGQLGVASSSRRYKNSIVDLDMDPETILNVRPVQFKYNAEHMSSEVDSDIVQLGFIAEELDELGLGLLVGYNPDGLPDDIQYSRYIVAMQVVVRHLASQISGLTSRIESLESK